MSRTIKERVFTTIDDLVSALLYYDRKEDEDLPRGVIEDLVGHGKLTVAEMTKRFEDKLREYFDDE